ncbi:MAG: ATP synthase F1 subunit epsilon [Candidatus Doudnabacteria bacterium]|nr:ATP synthase F1 subunit epsilon [Candidatus Doudnabacteria bacterium]
MNNISFKLVTPERTVLDQELVSLTCPTTLGQITILPGHASLVATLIPGELHARTGKDDFYIFVSGGFVQVNPNSEVIVLADSAEHHHEIDLKRAEEARARAQKALTEQKLSDEEYAKVAAALERSTGRLNIKRKHSHRKNPLAGEAVFKE